MGAMVEALDLNVGRLLDALDELGLRDNTIVIFFSDNGGVAVEPRESYEHPQPAGTMTSNDPLREGKASIYEGGVREPLIIDWPGVTKPGSVSEQLFVSVDFYPTLLEMLNLPKAPGVPFDGVSIVPALKGRPFDRGPVFIHFPHGNQKAWPGFQPSTSVRVGDWKLIRFYADTNDQRDRLELYNLKTDIGEQHNRVFQEPERALAMNQLISDWLEETGAAVPRANPAFNPEAAEKVYGDSWKNPLRYRADGAL